MYGNSPKYSQSRRNETKNSDNSMNNKIRLYLPKTIEAYPGFESNIGSRYLQFITYNDQKMLVLIPQVSQGIFLVF